MHPNYSEAQRGARQWSKRILIDLRILRI